MDNFNKKGDVPTAILVLGTFAVCALALISFFASNLFVENTFFGPELVEKMNSQVNEYNFYGSKNLDGEEIKEILLLEENFYINEEGKYFEINKSDEAFLPWKDDKFLFSVKYYVD
ncbi:hypothetical protein HYS72_03625 [Candidatus Pacearchaeota archaeon]|nr:hypothetical protein [Candidatus Pacearchaeota archaeon]MBI2056757.1 hypothetical protein [Candidatus Pacearchaeota archaeon]